MELKLETPKLTTSQFLEQLELVVLCEQPNKWKIERMKEMFVRRKEGKL